MLLSYSLVPFLVSRKGSSTRARMRPPQLQLTESMASSTKGPQVIHDSDSEPEANDTVPIHNRRSTRSLPRQEHYRNTHFATPHKPQSKQARTRLRHRINGQSRTDEASTVGFDGQDNRAAGSEKTLDPSLTSKRERTTITPETTSLGFRSEKPQQLSTGINAAPVRGTFASKSSNKSRHARVPIPLRSPSQPAAQRVDAVPEPPRPRTPVPHTQPASRIGSDNESDASEDILGPMDRARRRRKEHAGPNATTEETPNAIKLHQERIEPTALTHVLEEPRGKGHKLGRPKVSSETANSTPVLEASTITLTSPTAAEVGRFQSILRHHIERFKETHGRYVKVGKSHYVP